MNCAVPRAPSQAQALPLWFVSYLGFQPLLRAGPCERRAPSPSVPHCFGRVTVFKIKRTDGRNQWTLFISVDFDNPDMLSHVNRATLSAYPLAASERTRQDYFSCPSRRL
jgi:hypothetical protein